MPISQPLYNKALEIKSTLYPRLRTVTISDTLMPDDYNVPYQIMKALLEAVGRTSPIPHRVIGMKDDVYAEHVSDLRTICYDLWMYIYQKLLDPYINDPDFSKLKDVLDLMRLPKHGDELRTDEWNAISDYCRRMVDLILRYPLGFFEPWNDWSHVTENWYLDYEGYLDTSTYVSPPSSYTAPFEPEFIYVYDSQCELINPDYANVPYVQIETWAKTKKDWGERGGALGFLFRAESPPPQIRAVEEWQDETWRYALVFADSCYIIFFDTYQNKCKAYYMADLYWRVYGLIGEQTLVDKPAHANEWNKYRATLSKYGTGINIKLEYWDGSQWKTMASFNHDSDIYPDISWEGAGQYVHGVSISAVSIEKIEGVWKSVDVRTWIDDTLVTKL